MDQSLTSLSVFQVFDDQGQPWDYLPRLQSSLSLQNVKSLTLLVEPEIPFLEKINAFARGGAQRYRPDLLL